MKWTSHVLHWAPAVALIALLSSASANAALRTPRVSPDATIKQTIGITDLTMTYSRPGVKGRAIWGALVPYDTPWRAGANEATTFQSADDIQVGGQKLPAGKYSFFARPGKSDWTFIFSKLQDQWGTNTYDSTQDALRVRVSPEPAEFTEWMGFEFDSLTANSTRLSLRWEKLRVPVTLRADNDARMLAQIRKALPEAKSDDWTTPFQAARYAFENNLGTSEEVSGWLDRSLKISEKFQNLGLQARMFAKAGKKAEAIGIGEKAVSAEKIRVLKEGEERGDTKSLEKLIEEWKGKS